MRPGNKEKANLKLQIKNVEVQFEEVSFKIDMLEGEQYELGMKLQHLKSKLKKLAGKPSGENKKQKS